MDECSIERSRKQVLADLQCKIRRRERREVRTEPAVRSTGCGALDALFPSRGIRPGGIVEWVGEDVAGGAGTLSLVAGRPLCERPVVLVDQRREVFPAALAALGFDLARLVIVRPGTVRETLRVCEEALHCGGIGLVWAELDALPETAFRRLRLAAEASGGVGFLMRPKTTLSQPSWADVRFVVRPRSSREESLRFHVEVAYSQGNTRGSSAELMIDCDQGTLHEVRDACQTSFVSVVS